MVRTANPALLKPMNLSPELEAVIGRAPMSRGEVVKQIWVYIKKNNLQNPANKRNILADDKLKVLFGGKAEVTMFEMTKARLGSPCGMMKPPAVGGAAFALRPRTLAAI